MYSVHKRTLIYKKFLYKIIVFSEDYDIPESNTTQYFRFAVSRCLYIRPCYARTHASMHARHACNHAGLLLEHIFLSHASGCADCIVDRRVEKRSLTRWSRMLQHSPVSLIKNLTRAILLQRCGTYPESLYARRIVNTPREKM